MNGKPDPNSATRNADAYTVVRWLADDGAHVEENEPIVVLEAMKMETEITAPVAGILHRSAQVGDTAQYGDPLGAIG